MKTLKLSGIILSLVLVLAVVSSAIDLDLKIVTYGDFNYVNYTASSIDHAYFATTNGVTRYNILEHCWEEPLTATDGVDHFDISRIWSDAF